MIKTACAGDGSVAPSCMSRRPSAVAASVVIEGELSGALGPRGLGPRANPALLSARRVDDDVTYAPARERGSAERVARRRRRHSRSSNAGSKLAAIPRVGTVAGARPPLEPALGA